MIRMSRIFRLFATPLVFTFFYIYFKEATYDRDTKDFSLDPLPDSITVDTHGIAESFGINPGPPKTAKAAQKKDDGFARVQGKNVDHGMMDLSEVNVNVKAKMELEEAPALKVGLSENVDYADGFTFPTVDELNLNWSPEIKEQLSGYLHQGMNRKRQKNHGQEVPKQRYPDLIITGAKKCGTTALKIFMNYHPVFQDKPGERHFFNRKEHWNQGYEWYLSEMPLTYEDEVCYEKTPDYFDRPFVPERMKDLPNSDTVKFIHVLCDPVRRSFSHFLHMFTVQGHTDARVVAGFEFLSKNFGELSKEDAFSETIELAFKNLLGGKELSDVSDDEIRESVRDYFTKWDLKPGDPNRVFPLRIPDAILTGSLYSVHISTFLHYFTQDQMLYLDATELIENPGKSLRRVAQFMGVPATIDENNFYFDEEKGYYCMTPPVESGRASFCLGSEKGRSKDKVLPELLKNRIRRFYKPFLEDLTNKYSGDNYDHWDW